MHTEPVNKQQLRGAVLAKYLDDLYLPLFCCVGANAYRRLFDELRGHTQLESIQSIKYPIQNHMKWHPIRCRMVALRALAQQES